MKWYEKKVRGWTVPFWYSDTPICSKRFAQLTRLQLKELLKQIRK